MKDGQIEEAIQRIEACLSMADSIDDVVGNCPVDALVTVEHVKEMVAYLEGRVPSFDDIRALLEAFDESVQGVPWPHNL